MGKVGIPLNTFEKDLLILLWEGSCNRNHFKNVSGAINGFRIAFNPKMGQEKILVSVSPEYDQNKKRRFAVMSLSYPDGSKTLTVAALGGHSVAVCSPPGHYILGKESLQQHCPLVHNTSAVKDIEASGFLSQQKRLGGINFCSKRNIYRQKASHQIWIKFEDAKRASKDGITFFGNRFTEVFFALEHGSMANGVENSHFST